MKKTVKTAMTAAMFAASLGASANSAGYADSIIQGNAANVALDYTETMFTTTIQLVYGPPEVMKSLFGTTTTEDTTTTTQLITEGTSPIVTTTTEEEILTGGVVPIYTDDTEALKTAGEATVYTTCTTPEAYIDTYPVPVYGPPSYFYKTGDLNEDKSFDARDLTLIKRKIGRWLNEDPTLVLTYADRQQLDINGDGKLDKQDIIEYQRKLTGKPAEEEEPPVTTAVFTKENPTTTTTTFEDIPQPVYGPPEWFE
jgi:hypothetical protein